MSENMLFGLTMLIVGMGGTLITLACMAGILHLLTRIFPAHKPEHHSENTRP